MRSLLLETKQFGFELFKFFPNWITKYEFGETSNNGEEYQHHDWGVNKLNEIFPLKGKTVIEMGPQEAAHTIMMHNFGAKQIISLEGRLTNYIKCCIIKNIYELNNVKFYFEDLRSSDLKKYGAFDVCLCSGILYHLPEPQDLIAKISEVAPRILINSHVATEEFPKTETIEISLGKNKYRAKNVEEYNIDTEIAEGLQRFSLWLFRDDLIKLLQDVGYNKVKILNNWNDGGPNKAPAITVYAEKDKT